MEQPTSPSPSASNRIPRNRIAIVAVPAVVIIALLTFRTQIGRLFAPAVPTPPCGAATLQVGFSSFHILNIASQKQDVVNVPAAKPGTAYWVEGTTVHYAFGLSDTPENRALIGQLSIGEQVKVTWPDCRSEAFTIVSITPVEAWPSDLLDQSTAGATIFVPGSGGYGGWTALATKP